MPFGVRLSFDVNSKVFPGPRCRYIPIWSVLLQVTGTRSLYMLSSRGGGTPHGARMGTPSPKLRPNTRRRSAVGSPTGMETRTEPSNLWGRRDGGGCYFRPKRRLPAALSRRVSLPLYCPPADHRIRVPLRLPVCPRPRSHPNGGVREWSHRPPSPTTVNGATPLHHSPRSPHLHTGHEASGTITPFGFPSRSPSRPHHLCTAVPAPECPPPQHMDIGATCRPPEGPPGRASPPLPHCISRLNR